LTQVSEYIYIPGYIIEDESNDTSHEIGTLEAVDNEILGDYDACLYAGETLASCECYTRGYMYIIIIIFYYLNIFIHGSLSDACFSKGRGLKLLKRYKTKSKPKV
jgi:hypothetical protein